MMNTIWTVETNHPVATGSVDHTHPHGTMRDNSHSPALAKKIKDYIRELGYPGQVMDLGCAGGGFVKDCLDAGIDALGLEGSDYNLVSQRAEWATIPNNLFTCDIGKPFRVWEQHPPTRGRSLAYFDVITAWEVLEHIEPEDISQFFHTMAVHLTAQGVFIGSIACCSYLYEGIEYHRTVQPKEWWHEQFASVNMYPNEELYRYIDPDWLRNGELLGCWQRKY